jgi:hypothetical protein
MHHQPRCGGVKNQPHLIGGCAVTRHALFDHLVGARDIRYVVISLAGSAQYLYENVYCQRGQMENLIKLHKAQLASDRLKRFCPASVQRPSVSFRQLRT